MVKCLHVIDNFIFLPLTSKDPGYEVASFSVIFFYQILFFNFFMTFVLLFVKKIFLFIIPNNLSGPTEIV
jgi:hypothetical protein